MKLTSIAGVAAAFLGERGCENAELRLISPTNQTVFV